MTPHSLAYDLDTPYAGDSEPKRAVVTRLLQLFRASVGCEGGVVLATADGTPLAHDLPLGTDAVDAARTAAKERQRILDTVRSEHAPEPASAFVETPSGQALVVFVESDLVLFAGLGMSVDHTLAEWAALDVGEGVREVMEA